MPAIFIDANIYLRLYEGERVAALLPALKQFRADVFVPHQIVTEVERNRLHLAARHLKQLGPIRVPNVNVPEMLGSPAEVKKLKRRIDAARKQADRAHNELQALAARRLREIAAGADRVTAGLAPLFRSAVRETPEQLDRARLRKELGQRPGKPDDPLGDEVSWEQFLEQLKHDDQPIVVSADTDFVHELDDGVVLQPSLDREVRQKAKSGALAFTKLSALITYLKRESSPAQARALPSPKTLSDAAQAEAWLVSARALGTVTDDMLTPAFRAFRDRASSVPLIFEMLDCPKCGSEMSRLDVAGAEPWRCLKCGYSERV